MRILFATDQYLPTPGGITVVVHRLAHALTDKGHEVAIIAPSEKWKFHKEAEGKVTIFRVRSILINKIKNYRYAPTFLFQKNIDAIIKNFAPDIIHIETPYTIAAAAIDTAERVHVPVIGTCHIMPQNISGVLPFLPSQIRRVVGNIYMKQLAQVFNDIDFVTAPTQTGIAILKADGVNVPMQELSNGIDLEKFHRVSEKEQEALRKKLKLPHTPLILYVGRLDKEKRVEVLISSLAKLPSNIFYHAVIAGTGDQYQVLTALAKKLHLTNKITFLGILDEKELRALYSLATVFVMPSTAELQSLVTMEAMAEGKPVIGAKAGALPYLIHDGENGYLFTPEHALDLAQKIKKILGSASLQESFGKASLRLIQRHSMHTVVAELEKLYQKVIMDKREYPTALAQPSFEETGL